MPRARAIPFDDRRGGTAHQAPLAIQCHFRFLLIKWRIIESITNLAKRDMGASEPAAKGFLMLRFFSSQGTRSEINKMSGGPLHVSPP